jgi:hypothetical protein
MSFVLNEWKVSDTDPDTTQLTVCGVYNVTALVATADVEHLKLFSWCYEQAKGNIYAMDFSMELPDLLGIKSPRVYLWKYVVYIHTGRVAKAWKRDNINDYRFKQGQVQYIDMISIAGA